APVSDLLAKLKELPNKLANGIVDEALEEAARPMLDTAKALAPVETGRPGDRRLHVPRRRGWLAARRRHTS
ncbi:MAG: HK97 gp10 family phage protein, partial [Planctomycetaceae bacterium]|nr:HK97 gp10 family phage protein [Planctomycetaceae bacterium]